MRFMSFSPEAALDRRRKAAIIVRFLLSEGQRPPLADLAEEAQVELTREMGRLRVVDRATLDSVLQEFADTLEGVGLAAPSGEEAALDALSSHISLVAVARLRAEATLRRGADPWAALASLGAAELAEALGRESVEVAAVALSKLPVAKAAEVLGRIPGPQARRISFAVSRTGQIAPDTLLRIGRALVEEHCSSGPRAFEKPPGERLGAILNTAAPATRDEVLGSLDAEDRDFAASVRKAIFTFRHLPQRLKPMDVPRVLRGVAPRVAALALASAQKGAPDDVAAAEFLLASLPQRLADSLREEMAALERIKPAEADAAQAALVAAVRERVEAGEIELVETEEEGEAA
jgi:flagellar motor switch protein FliG